MRGPRIPRRASIKGSKRRFLMRRTVSMFTLLAFVVGCFQSAPPPPPTAKARGKIVGVGGEPLNHVVVRLQPLNQTAGGEAQGVVKEGGTFVLQTFRPEDGAMPGKYKVWLQPSPV